MNAELSDYVGTVTAETKDGTFRDENIKVNFAPDESGTTCTLTIYEVKFSATMPVRVDVVISPVEIECKPGKIVLSCDNVVPTALGGPFPGYTIKGFKGEIKGGNFSFSTKFGSTPTVYSGTIEPVFE